MQLGLGRLSLSCVQQAGGGEGEETPAWLEDFRAPSGDLPIAAADIVNGNYWLDGAVAALGDIIDTSVFNAGNFVDAAGLNVDGLVSIPLVGTLATFAKAASWTVRGHVVVPGDESPPAHILFISDAGAGSKALVSYTSDGRMNILDESTSAESTRGISSVIQHAGSVPFVIAGTRTDEKIAGSILGEVVFTQTSPTFSLAGENITIAAFVTHPELTTGPSVIKSFAIYDQQPDADLPTLSAPPEGVPENTAAPVISGTPVVDQTLSCTTGTWTGDAPISYTYQWLADGDEIDAATDDEFLLTGNETSDMITCRVTATNAAWLTHALSNELGPVEATILDSIFFAGDTEITEYINTVVIEVQYYINFEDCSSLVNFECPSLQAIGTVDDGTVTFIGCALPQGVVDAILVQLAGLDGTNGTTLYENETVNLSGGTNAIPSATGLTAKATLEGRGCTVTVNS